MSQEDILIASKKTIVVNEKSYQIGKLSIAQTWKISKLLAKALVSRTDLLKQIQEKTTKSTSNAADLLTILDLLNEDDMVTFFKIILKDDAINEIELESAIEIVAIVCEQNKVLSIKKKINRIVLAVKAMMTKTD